MKRTQVEMERTQVEMERVQAEAERAQAKGQGKLLSLIRKMTENGENELLSRLSNDPAFLEEMYQKYQITN